MIKIDHISKKFRVYKTRFGMLKDALGIAKSFRDYDDIESLKDVSLEIPQGKVHGIIGMNGAGKSTLLKILSGVLHPTTGKIEVSGRIAALLELGTGFHGDLTGRENIYLNGAMVGLNREQIDERIAAIFEFSELGDFIDRPVKIYSSGMYVRLAFSFSVAVDPDILIIDEALSVGDAYFQQKCLKRIRQFKEAGTTILFVSHDLGAVKMLCDEVTLLSQGANVFTGKPIEALDLYNAMLAKHQSGQLQKSHEKAGLGFGGSAESGSRDITIKRTLMRNREGKEVNAIIAGEIIEIQVEAEAQIDGIVNPTCGILIRDRLGYDVFGTNSYYLQKLAGPVPKGKSIMFKFTFPLNLGEGDYTLTVAIHQDQSHTAENYHWIERAIIFKVIPDNDFKHIGVIKLPVSCSIQ